MKFTYKHITLDGTETTTYTVDENNKVTVKVKFEHDKFAEFDKWFAKLEKKYNEYKADKYLYIKTIAEELRGLAVEKDIPIFTATQTNREGYGDSDPDLTNTSESWGLPATADFMFAMMTDDQLEQLSQFRIKQLKNRYNRKDSNKRFCIGYDLMKMRLFDVDDSSVGSVSAGQQEDTPTHGSSFLQKKKTLDFSGISI